LNTQINGKTSQMRRDGTATKNYSLHSVMSMIRECL